MPLPPHAARTELHTRIVTVRGYRRDDGLFDIEGQMTDTKTYPFFNEWRGEVPPGEPVHGMWLRLTVDDRLTVVAAVASTDHSPFRVCPTITPQYEKLVGLRIGGGWTRKTRELLGGSTGCTHLTELLGPIATTAFQTVGPYLGKLRAEARARGETVGEDPVFKDGEIGPDGKRRPPTLLDSCHAFAATGDLARARWPNWAKPKDAPAEPAAEAITAE